MIRLLGTLVGRAVLGALQAFVETGATVTGKPDGGMTVGRGTAGRVTAGRREGRGHRRWAAAGFPSGLDVKMGLVEARGGVEAGGGLEAWEGGAVGRWNIRGGRREGCGRRMVVIKGV